MWQQGAPAVIVRGETKNAPPPTTYRERDPPHGENGSHIERKDCPHRKNAPILFMYFPPGERLLCLPTCEH